MKWSDYKPGSYLRCNCFQRQHTFTRLSDQDYNDDGAPNAPSRATKFARQCVRCCCCCLTYPSTMAIRTIAAISILVLIAAVHPNYMPCKVVELVYLPAYTVSGRPVYGIRATLRETVDNVTTGTNTIVVPRKESDLLVALSTWHQNSTHICAYNKLTGVLRVGQYAMGNAAAAWTIFCIIMSAIAVIYISVADVIATRLWRAHQDIFANMGKPDENRISNPMYNVHMIELHSNPDDPDELIQTVCEHCNQPIDLADTKRKLLWCKWGCKKVYHEDCVIQNTDGGMSQVRKCKCGKNTMFGYLGKVSRDNDDDNRVIDV